MRFRNIHMEECVWFLHLQFGYMAAAVVVVVAAIKSRNWLLDKKWKDLSGRLGTSCTDEMYTNKETMFGRHVDIGRDDSLAASWLWIFPHLLEMVIVDVMVCT